MKKLFALLLALAMTASLAACGSKEEAPAEEETVDYASMSIDDLKAAITTVTEWKRIHTKAVKKVLYAFTFPLFMFTYIPISFAALFSKGEWKPIEHRVSAASLRGRGREELLPF